MEGRLVLIDYREGSQRLTTVAGTVTREQLAEAINSAAGIMNLPTRQDVMTNGAAWVRLLHICKLLWVVDDQVRYEAPLYKFVLGRVSEVAIRNTFVWLKPYRFCPEQYMASKGA